jgi:hypothetical protein
MDLEQMDSKWTSTALRTADIFEHTHTTDINNRMDPERIDFEWMASERMVLHCNLTV